MFNKIGAIVGKYKTYIFLVLLCLLSIRVIIPQLDDLKDGIATLQTADLNWVLSAVVIYFMGIPLLAVQIKTLALKPLKYGLTLKVEMATQFASKILPSFVGLVSMNMYYMVKEGHSSIQAATVMTANAMTSGVAYTCLIVLGVLASSIPKLNLDINGGLSTNLVLLILLLILGAIFTCFHIQAIRRRIYHTYSDVKSNIMTYRDRPLSLLLATICNGAGSTINIAVLYMSAHALGIDISFATALLAYTCGNIAMSLMPTPGGLGAVEAGIYTGLVIAGVPGANAITITLLYRLITYWIPILPSYYFFWGLRKNILSDFSFKNNAT